MDDIVRATTASTNKKKELIRDIVKYQNIINNNHIKTFFEKYITQIGKS